MQEHGVREVRQAGEALVAAVAGLDLTEDSPAVCRDLWHLADRLEGTCRAAAAEVTARLSAGTPADRGAPDRLSHPLRRVDV
jgi:hypothetical protein